MDAPHPCPECTPKSQPYCGFCGDGPYSPTGPFASRVRKSRAPDLVTRESLLAEFDAMAADRRAEVARRVGGVGSATADTTRGEGIERAPKGPPVSPRKKRRTKIEMQEFRADKARQIEASYRELVPEGHWLDEPDESMDQLLETLRDSET